MIMRRAVLRALVNMAKNAETQIGIFIKNRPFDLHIRAEMLNYKLGISACFFSILADQLPTRPTGILQQCCTATAANWSSV